jgi:hypothetical protein
VEPLTALNSNRWLPDLPQKYLTRMEVSDIGKHSYYDKAKIVAVKKFNSTGTNVIKLFSRKIGLMLPNY